MNSVSKLKVVAGYALLLGVLLFSLFFVHREMENLMHSDKLDMQWADSLIALLHEKDANTIYLLQTLSEANEDVISTREVENIIAEQQDSVQSRQRVQHRVVTHRDTVMTPHKKKGFFRRLGEVFVPPKKDSTIEVKTSLEFATDTLIDVYNPVDSLQEKIRAVAQQKREGSVVAQRRKRTLQRTNRILAARIDSLLKEYEQETLLQARQEAEFQQEVRRNSAKVIGGIAVGAVLLSVVFLAVIGKDITRSNRYRRELEEAHRRAEELLAARERLMLAITHDFKAPLGSIMGYADLLSRLTVDERQRFYLDNMKTSSEHLLKLVVDLLDFHRLDLHKMEVNRATFHPARLLEEICTSFEPLITAKGITLQKKIAPELENGFVCDPLRLRQIISNLLSNAVKFTDRGTITLSARYEERRLVVAVSDTGRGMEPADCERIFQEFTRLPGAQGEEGFGLGLSIVRRLVQLLEGRIDVESHPGVGSTFTLHIPIYPVAGSLQTALQEKAVGNVDPPAKPSPSLRVLLIDDDRIQLTLTAAMLAQQGIGSLCCPTVDELLDALRSDSFDLLLTDVQMPAINGFDLLRLLRASNIPQARTIPVVAVTARNDMDAGKLAEYGFVGCLHKPFTVAELLQILELEKGMQGSAVAEKEAPPAGEQPVSSPAKATVGYDFGALTAFLSDDPDAAKSILDSFASETKQHVRRLQTALETETPDELAAVAHKMIPLCTLIRATELVGLLRKLEACRGTAFTEDLKTVALSSIRLIEDVMDKMNALTMG